MKASDDTTEAPSFERTPAEIAELMTSGARLVDVRQPYEFDAARIPGLRPAGENVAYITGCAPSSDRVIVRMWMASVPHRRNILSPSFRMIGAGTALRGRCGATFATTEFAG